MSICNMYKRPVMSLTGHRRWCRSSWWPDHLRNWGTSWSENVSYMGLRKTDYDARRRDKLFVRCHGITFTSLAFPLAVTVSLIFARRGQGTQTEDIGSISSVQHSSTIFSSEQSQSCRPPFVILVKKVCIWNISNFGSQKVDYPDLNQTKPSMCQKR